MTKLAQDQISQRNSCEIHSGEGLVRLFFVKNPHMWFPKEDVVGFLEKNGKKLAVRTLYNILCKLKRLDLIESRRSSFAEYRLKELKCEKHPAGGGFTWCSALAVGLL